MGKHGLTRRPPYLLLLVCGLLYFPRLGGRDLWNPDEPRFALIADEMLLTGDYVVLHRNEEVYAKKPPLLFWCIALLGRIAGGISECVARIPSALAATGLVLLTFFFGRSFWNPRTGLLAALVLATSVLFFWEARFIQTDMLFSFLVVASIFCLYGSLVRADPSWISSLLGYAAAGLAILTKGPLAMVLVFLALGPFGAWRWASTRRSPGIRGLLPHMAGLALCLAIALPWYVLSFKRMGPQFFQQNLFRENLERFFNPFDHRNPFYYYLLMLPLDFFPWSVFLPAGLFLLWQQRNKDPGSGLPAAFLLLWMGFTFFFFSTAGSKQGKYLLPMYPPLALAVATVWDAALENLGRGMKPWGVFIPLCLIHTALVAAAIGSYSYVQGQYRDLSASVSPTLFLLLAGGIGGAVCLIRNRVRDSVSCLFATLLAAYFTASLFAFPAMNRYKSARPLCERYLQVAAVGDRAGYLGPDAKSNAYIYYTARKLEELQGEKDVVRFATQPGKAFLFVPADDFRNLSPEARGDWDILDQRKVGDREMLLLTNVHQ